jgi:neutral ceramidase
MRGCLAWKTLCQVFLLATLIGAGDLPALGLDDSSPGWKAGVASVVITPDTHLWMAGYAARDKPADGKVHDLHAKAIALEDATGTRLVIVTVDLISITRSMRDWLVTQTAEQYQLEPKSLLLNASHTHCGPEIRPDKVYLPKDQVAKCKAYAVELRHKLLHVIGQALENLAPAQLSYTHARAGFAMNRRTPTAKGVQNHPYPDGPVDHDVPVLLVKADEDIQAVLFGYACHSTTLSFYQYCGDYAGFAKQYLEEAHPGLTAMFMAGCGGDQNPYPRRSLELCQQHGRALANAVETALQTYAKPVHGPLSVAYQDAQLEFAPPPTREQLEEDSRSQNKWKRLHAESLLNELNQHQQIRTNYAAPVQVVRFGRDLVLVALSGEVVVDFALRLKQELAGPAVWVAGYSNDVFGYVPSLRVLREGGYEGGGAMLYSSLPGPFAESVEDRVVTTVHELAEQTRREIEESTK